MSLLAAPVVHLLPWPWFSVEEALPRPWCEALERLFDVPRSWELHEGGFYEAYMATVTGELDPGWRAPLIARMAALTGVPLAPGWRVTIQRMETGQHALPHSDRPLVGYEAVRLVLQLNRGWRPEHGGLFEVLDGAGEPVVRREPRYNSAAGFVMRPVSQHAVTPVVGVRRSVVFNFWHVGNTEPLATAVADLFDGMRVDRLPAALDPLMVDAEQRYSDEDTLRAAAVAWVLQRWHADAPTVVLGYQAALGEADGADPLLQLAIWAARLHLEDFDVDGWAALRARVADDRIPAAARPFARLALPSVGPGQDR